jgi:hypothetical protein
VNEIKKKWALHKSICVRPFCSYDYQQQRSITSTSIETIIDDTNDKRDDHRHQQQQQRINISRQPQQYPSSSNNNSSERSYTHGRVFLRNYFIHLLLLLFFSRINISTTIKIWIKPKSKYFITQKFRRNQF